MARVLQPHPGAPPPPGSPSLRGAGNPGPAETLDQLVRNNLGFVVKVACEYRNLGLPLEDLVGEGSIGLIQAAARYDPGRGTKFVTYASAWVRKSILRALSQSTRTIRIPAYHQDKLKLYQRAEALLSGRLGRRPAREEISQALKAPARRVEALLSSRIFEVPLEAAEGRAARKSLIRTVADPGASDPERTLLRDESQLLVEDALSILTPREREIIVSRFGLTGDPRASLRELAVCLRLSRERVRQIEEHAKEKIRRRLQKKVLYRGAHGTTMRRRVFCARHPASARPGRSGEEGPA